jgi:hypothetical protein
MIFNIITSVILIVVTIGLGLVLLSVLNEMDVYKYWAFKIILPSVWSALLTCTILFIYYSIKYPGLK